MCEGCEWRPPHNLSAASLLEDRRFPFIPRGGTLSPTRAMNFWERIHFQEVRTGIIIVQTDLDDSKILMEYDREPSVRLNRRIALWAIRAVFSVLH